MNKLAFSGTAGELRWGYQPAAVLGSWTLTDDTLTAQVVSHDAFRTSQPSLTFRVNVQNGAHWEWRVAELSIAGQSLRATLLQESTDG